MIAYRKLCLPVITENLSPARASLIQLFRRVHVSISDELEDGKLPQKPKKPMNGYLRFSRSVFDEYKQNNPEKKVQDIQKLIATAWASLDEAKKQEYTKQFKEDSEIYKKKLEQYKDMISKFSFPKETSDPNVLKLKSQVFQKPKKPPNAFLLYKTSRRSEQDSKNLSFKEWATMVAEDWHKLPAEEKNVFVEMASKMSAEYKLELAAWSEKMLAEGHTDILFAPRKVKGTSHDNINLQAGQVGITESTEDTSYKLGLSCDERSGKKRSKLTDQLGSSSASSIKGRSQVYIPPVTLAAPDIHHPKDGEQLNPNINSISHSIQNLPLEDTGSCTKDAIQKPKSHMEYQSVEKYLQDAAHTFQSVCKHRNIKMEYLVGGTCSLICSVGFCFWYLS